MVGILESIRTTEMIHLSTERRDLELSNGRSPNVIGLIVWELQALEKSFYYFWSTLYSQKVAPYFYVALLKLIRVILCE